MTIEARYVSDTNAVVSALLLMCFITRRGFDLARNSGALLMSISALAELSDVLHRDRFNKYITEQERQPFLAGYAREGVLVQPMGTI